MKAAVVTDFNQAPQYTDFTDPTIEAGETGITVLAASVNQLVRSQADGSHYSSDHKLPMIPGVDGVGKTDDGQLVYFNANTPVYGALAERTVVNSHLVLPLTGDVAPEVVAATVNPAMSSYMAIEARLGAENIKDKTVLILGVTGNAGRLAVTIAKHFGAAKVIGVGRNPERLADAQKLGAEVVNMGDETALKQALPTLANVDVVLDYLWGDATAQFMVPMLQQRENRSQPLTWIEIGSIAGQTVALPAAALRSTNLTLIGSGLGSISRRDFLGNMPGLLALIEDGTLVVATTAYPLSTVHENWPTQTTARVVFKP